MGSSDYPALIAELKKVLAPYGERTTTGHLLQAGRGAYSILKCVVEDSTMPYSADDIRAKGWAVAVHNDYFKDGERYTFWLFTDTYRIEEN